MRAVCAAALVLMATQAHAGPKADEERTVRVPAHRGDLWPPQLPLDPGPLPEGLASASAQGCAACHGDLTEAWSASAHAGAAPEALVSASLAAEAPACLGCHQPLVAQHPHPLSRTPTGMTVDRSSISATWSPSLAAEGVTCIACHQRDGRILGVSPEHAAPHPLARRDDLASSATCATCHQLTWPGAEAPLYDTWGEWSRSAWADAGVGCADCHMAAGPAGADHGVPASLARALTALVRLQGPVLTRGDGLTGELLLQNSGAGHAVPTGSPFTGLRLLVSLVPPDHHDGDAVPVMETDLQRSVSDVAPWAVLSDTRLPAGATRSWPLVMGLPGDAPIGRWTLRVSLAPTRGGALSGPAEVVRALPLEVR